MAKTKPKQPKKSPAPAGFDRSLIRMCTDVFPSASQLERFAELARAEDISNIIPGLAQALCAGIVMPRPVRIAFVTAKKWANGRTLKVAFMGGTSQQQEFTAKTADKWSSYGNITFQWGVQAAQSDLRVAYTKAEGAYSYIGTDNLGIAKNRKTMNLGWLDEAVVLHEFGHAVGAIHEHQHPEAKIPWNKEAVYAYFGGPPNYWDRQTIDSNLFDAYSVGQTQFSAYDRTSIMHYAIDAALLTDASRAVGWNSVLSTLDAAQFGKLYPKDVVPPPPPPVGGKLRGTWEVDPVAKTMTGTVS